MGWVPLQVISKEYVTSKYKEHPLLSSHTNHSCWEELHVRVFLQMGNVSSNADKIRMTQLLAHLFVVIPVSFGGKSTTVDLHEGLT